MVSETLKNMETSDTANTSGVALLIWSFQMPNADDVAKKFTSGVPSENEGNP
jgi:hypothetical protein